MSQLLRKAYRFLSWPWPAKWESLVDRLGPARPDPGLDRAVELAIGWLGRAQDRTVGADGGVSHNFSLADGWQTSYPETTGYIIPTMIEWSRRSGTPEARDRARRMLDWLLSIQLPDGGFQGGRIGALSDGPVTFNTGQILLGLAAGAQEFGNPYLDAMHRAASWLMRTQASDGSWRAYPSHMVEGEHDRTYDTHVAWALLEAARVAPEAGYENSARANVDWAIGKQRPNGWIEDCCLTSPGNPLTHTLGYALRGILEAHRFFGDESLLASARRTADGILTALRPDGWLPGQLRPDWSPGASWVCLTGSVQVAHCWLILYRATGESRYHAAGRAANRFVRRTIRCTGDPDKVGAVKGSFPVDGAYMTHRYPNWACKFFIDSQLLEKDIDDTTARNGRCDSVAQH